MKQGNQKEDADVSGRLGIGETFYRVNLEMADVLTEVILLALPFCLLSVAFCSRERFFAFPSCEYLALAVLMLPISLRVRHMIRGLKQKAVPDHNKRRILDYGMLAYLLFPGLCMGLFGKVFPGQSLLLGATVVAAGAVPVIHTARLLFSFAVEGLLLAAGLVIGNASLPGSLTVLLIFIFSAGTSLYISRLRYRAASRQFRQLRRMAEKNRELIRLNEELSQISETDPLTRVFNRRKLHDFASTCWREMSRQRLPFSVIMVDIDNFKKYNDYYGHLEGDYCLSRVARVIRCCMPAQKAEVFRYGGEEFVVLTAGLASEDVMKLAMAIREAVTGLHAEHKALGPAEIVTVSIGVCTEIPSDERSYTHILKNADTALYAAKQLGRNRVIRYPCEPVAAQGS